MKVSFIFIYPTNDQTILLMESINLSLFCIFAENDIVMDKLIVTPKSKKEIAFLTQLLRSLGQVENVKLVKDSDELFASLSESSLLKEWNSLEDERWDNLLKQNI